MPSPALAAPRLGPAAQPGDAQAMSLLQPAPAVIGAFSLTAIVGYCRHCAGEGVNRQPPA